MNEGWIVFGIIFLALLGATLPLLHKEPPSRPQNPDDHQQIEK